MPGISKYIWHNRYFVNYKNINESHCNIILSHLYGNSKLPFHMFPSTKRVVMHLSLHYKCNTYVLKNRENKEKQERKYLSCYLPNATVNILGNMQFWAQKYNLITHINMIPLTKPIIKKESEIFFQVLKRPMNIFYIIPIWRPKKICLGLMKRKIQFSWNKKICYFIISHSQ